MKYAKYFLYDLWFGVRKPFQEPIYFLLFAAAALAMFALYVFIPVWAVPGNSLSLQLAIFTVRDYLTLAFLSFLSSLFITMQIYAARHQKKILGAGAAAGGGLTAIFAGVAGTAFCPACLAPLFALFGIGFGGAVFITDNRWYFVGVITIFMIIAIYLIARKINKVCNSC